VLSADFFSKKTLNGQVLPILFFIFEKSNDKKRVFFITEISIYAFLQEPYLSNIH